MTEAMRDAVRALFRVAWGIEIDDERVDGIIKMGDDSPFYTNAEAVLASQAPHTAAAQAAAVAAAVLAEREACAALATQMIPNQNGFRPRWHSGAEIAAFIRARTQESGR